MLKKKKKTKKKCAKCGDVVKSYSYGDFCSSCAADVWDAGFESTTQHANEIYEQEQKNLDEINEYLANSEINLKDLRSMIEYETGVFRCAKCNKLLLRWVYSPKDEAKLQKILSTPCPKCNISGSFKFGD